ncbi:MAG TPA: hypothetical protein HA341_01390 [Halobacteria archaeon]|nr:hypothetical protein [Halobacteria archaeon]
MKKEWENLSAEKQMELQLKNLKVSRRIAEKEIEDLLVELKNPKCNDKEKKIRRIAECEKIIQTKTKAIEPLQIEWNKIKPEKGRRTNVTQDEISDTMKKYNLG